MQRHACRAPLLVFALAAAAIAAGFGADPAELFRVSSSLGTTSVQPGQDFDLKITFRLGEGVHLYKKQLAFTWDELTGAQQREVVLPKGEPIDDPFAGEAGAKTEGYEGTVEIAVRFHATAKAGEPIVVRGTLRYQGCSGEQCFLPMRHPIEVKLAAGAAAPPTPTPASATVAAPTGEPGDELGLGAFLSNVLLAFVAGLLISFTPCVYPMIPITVAIIGGRAQCGRARAIALSAVYVLGIAITYSVIGVLIASLGGAVRNALQSPWLLVPIAAIFVVLALAMFDVITLQTPGSVGGLASKVSGKSRGVFGVLLLGVVSGLVAGPCVAAPLAGVLIRIARTGSAMLGFWSMFALAWGMGLILIVAGASAGLLPKAGTWMVWVKKLLGFVLLWAAAYFLQPVIGVDSYYLATAGVLLAAAVFLGCLDSLAPDAGVAARIKRLLGLSAVFAAAGFAFAGSFQYEPRAAASFAAGDPESVDAALASGKPVVLDFSAEWCAPCKELDHKTFSDPRVAEELQRFRVLKIDVDKTENRQLIQRFEIVGPPTVVLFDADGKARDDLSFSGFKGPDAFLELLKKVR